MRPGTIIHDPCLYRDREGRCKAKYIVVLAVYDDGVIWRTLTSRGNGRRRDPRCFHGDPYPAFYLGVVDTHAGLGKESWVDLRSADDYERPKLSAKIADERVKVVSHVGNKLLRALLECAASADDTTTAQERHLRDLIAKLT